MGLNADFTPKLKVHGNRLDSKRLTTLYKLVDQSGELLKWGITSQQNPLRRYTKKFLEGKRLIPVKQGTRRDMAREERALVASQPGTMNKEPWRGKG